jgi:hypothetical protein
MSRIHWVPRGTGTPKDKDEVNKRESSECDGCVCKKTRVKEYMDKERGPNNLFIYHESTKRKLKTKYICGCRCYERLQTKTKEFTRLK